MPIPVTPPGGGKSDKNKSLPQRPSSSASARNNRDDDSRSLPAAPASPSLPSRPSSGSSANTPSRPTRPTSGIPARPSSSPSLPALPSSPSQGQSTPEPSPEIPSASVVPDKPQQEIPDFLKQPNPNAPTEEPHSPFETPQKQQIDQSSHAKSAPAPASTPKKEEGDKKGKRKKFRETAGHDSKVGKRNKGTNNLVRYITLGLLFVFCGLGAKAAFIPPVAPSTGDVVDAVQEMLGYSGFPRETAEGFVLSFTEAYLSTGSTEYDKEEPFGQYVESGLIAEISETRPYGDLKIIEGPYISGIREESKNDATFTVKALLANKKWMYIDIPVQWNDDGSEGSSSGTNLAISGVPTVVPAPTLTNVTANTEEFEVDEEGTEAFQKVADSFFRAWGASDNEGLSAFTVSDGNNRASTGLQGAVKFDSTYDIKVSGTIPGLNLGGPSTEWGVREARVSVNWSIPGTQTEEDPDTLTSYSSTYRLALTYDSTAQKWVVFDIKSQGLLAE